MDEIQPWPRRRERRQLSISETICESVAHAAEELDMKAVAVFTQSGTTARLVSKYRPKCPIYAFAHEAHITNQLNLLWGVMPIHYDIPPTAEGMVRGAEAELIRRGVVKTGEVMGMISGTMGSSGSTNLIRLHTVGTGNISGAPEQRKTSSLKPTSAKKKQN
jgi:pyruvate kinase